MVEWIVIANFHALKHQTLCSDYALRRKSRQSTHTGISSQTPSMIICITSKDAMSTSVSHLTSSLVQMAVLIRKFCSREPQNYAYSDLFRREPLTIQLAFAYTYIPSVDDEVRTIIKRRLRLQTVQVPVVKERLQFYRSANSSAVQCLLTHKVGLHFNQVLFVVEYA